MAAKREKTSVEEQVRCGWAGSDPIYVAYHDREWGVPVRDDQRLFEFLVLEGAQAGLSWITILRKRDAYRAAFDEFVPEKVARYDARRVAKLLDNAGIVRNRAKIASAVKNARAFMAVQEEFGTFAKYQWDFVDDEPVVNRWPSLKHDSAAHAALGRPQQGSEAARVQLRRFDDRLRAPASRRRGERPPRHLLSPRPSRPATALSAGISAGATRATQERRLGAGRGRC